MIKIEISGKSNSLGNDQISKLTVDKVKKINPDKNNILIEIIFVNKNRIRELNWRHRHKNCPTDVLSFPQQHFDVKNNILGTIVICEEIGHNKGISTEKLIIHGLIHLIGYDHQSDQKKWSGIEKCLE